MTITLPLEPEQEAKLIALAKEKGISPDGLVREAIERLLGEVQAISSSKAPTRSLRGLLAKYGPAPSAEEIDRNRTEMFANFPSSDF
jgi:predicted DNA-binding protein